MQSLIGVRWVKNKQESWYCELVLRRLTNFPAEIRCYIQQFLYDCVCLLDEPFHQLGVTWSPLQLKIYRAVITGPMVTKICIPSYHGLTTVIAGMALSLMLLGFKAVIIAKDFCSVKKCMSKVRSMYEQYHLMRASTPLPARSNAELLQLNNGGWVRCVPNNPHMLALLYHRHDPDIIFVDNVDGDVSYFALAPIPVFWGHN